MNSGECRPLQILIIGASARAAAFSALRGGLKVQCADLFADFDLQKQAPVSKIENYPHDLPKIVAESSADYWLYTGAVENYPDLIEQAAAAKLLLGNRADALQLVRDPFWLKDLLGDAFPDVSRTRPVGDDGDWLFKPYRSAGGIGIRFEDELPAEFTGEGYYQRYIPAEPTSGVFIAAGGKAKLLGAAKSEDRAAEEPFVGYANWQTTDMGSKHRERIETIGQQLAQAAPLAGLFGVDFVGDYLLEVNPRYTASCEVLERIYEQSFVQLHMQACQTGELPNVATWTTEKDCGKSIVFAERDLVIPEKFTSWAMSQNKDKLNPRIADIPHPHESILQGRPVCTLIAQRHRDDHFKQLASDLYSEVDRLLYEG